MHIGQRGGQHSCQDMEFWNDLLSQDRPEGERNNALLKIVDKLYHSGAPWVRSLADFGRKRRPAWLAEATTRSRRCTALTCTASRRHPDRAPAMARKDVAPLAFGSTLAANRSALALRK
jgi:hypothetical protein